MNSLFNLLWKRLSKKENGLSFFLIENFVIDETLTVMEIELIEPNLFLSHFPSSAEKLAQKIYEKISFHQQLASKM
jgi:hypothetical protein